MLTGKEKCFGFINKMGFHKENRIRTNSNNLLSMELQEYEKKRKNSIS